MHMANALISPLVSATMLTATGTIMGYSLKKIPKEDLQDKLPLMSVIGAFVFAAQMINFTIPGTGSSGHLGGGMLLAILLGPYAGFLAMGAILLVQSLFFADGGLLAYGCNVFNLGFYTCFIAYPLIYKPMLHNGFSKKKLIGAAMLSSIIGLQLGAFSVVMQTLISGRTTMLFSEFLLAMQPIHLAIGIVEGAIISTVLIFIHQSHPRLVDAASNNFPKLKMKKLIIVCMLCTFIVGGVFSLFASSNPDGLEWAISKITGTQEVQSEGVLYDKAEALQEHFAILPDYTFKIDQSPMTPIRYIEKLGTSTSGILGSLLTATFILAIGLLRYGLKSLRRISL
ncbi:energy-coupling factor ABC transporter permease [Cellulosilyticum sp. I15G10I2]|uniref:energy-coupling factor ABC transporter permease n=1 Tax=Cellulosilyticum sp. I15G10I2 TaxID=1892843 RepID=UPI00085C4CD9|nr:energy-coupling factor ABC transporter permease [Cellulosilyticum sp. I15G10I2]